MMDDAIKYLINILIILKFKYSYLIFVLWNYTAAKKTRYNQ